MTQHHRIGDLISLGAIEWIVLDVSNETMFLITREIIEKRPFHESYESVTWESCSLRAYLNNEFIERFRPDELARMARGSERNDKVFLLSVEEASLYFSSDSERISHFHSTPRWWYLRTAGIGNHAAFVDKGGAINTHGCRVDNPHCGVRPAINIKTN